MSTTKHTPQNKKDWRANRNVLASIIEVIDENEKELKTNLPFRIAIVKRMSDAQLISAAYDMLEALEIALPIVEKYSELKGIHPSTLIGIRAAISKAKGNPCGDAIDFRSHAAERHLKAKSLLSKAQEDKTEKK